jgi:hypothetical protein
MRHFPRFAPRAAVGAIVAILANERKTTMTTGTSKALEPRSEATARASQRRPREDPVAALARHPLPSADNELCPKCGSSDTRRSHSRALFDPLARALGFLPRRCRACRCRYYTDD